MIYKPKIRKAILSFIQNDKKYLKGKLVFPSETRISSRLNMHHKTLRAYLRFFMRNNIITNVSNTPHKKAYKITDSGEEYLNKVQKMLKNER